MKKIVRKVKSNPKLVLLLVTSVFAILISIWIANTKTNVRSRAQIAVTWPTEPPARICGTGVTTNPSQSQPAGSVRVEAGDNSGVNWNQPGATFWFAPGLHTLAPVPNGQIPAVANATYIGAPGAILDGQGVNAFAFWGGRWDGTSVQDVPNVKIKYLTIQNFNPPKSQGAVNQDAGTGWEVAYNNISNNLSGAGMMIGARNNVHHNCFDSNGQYAFNAYHAGDTVADVIVDSNEIKNNNTADYERIDPGCGCTGGGKFWAVKRAKVTNNWVHDNKSVGIWADYNNVEFLIDNNLVENNDAQGIFYEVSYNFMITNNNIRGNNRITGLKNQGEGFPYAGIYISESGGDTRAGSVYTHSEVHHNNLENNWDGIILWENSDRYCKSPFGGVQATCPFFDQTEGTRNLTQNVSVHDNVFKFDKTAVGCTSEYCGRNGIFSNFSSNTRYPGFTIADAVTYNQNNHFSNNTYIGPWGFTIYDQGPPKGWDIWQKDPVKQDAGSTCPDCRMGGSIGGGSGGAGTSFDLDTATLEGSLGKWQAWFSSAISQSTEKANSGTASLKVDVTAPNGWGVQLSNWPGFSATPGTKTLSFSGLLGQGNMGANMNVTWRDSTNADLQTDIVSIPSLTFFWQKATKQVTAPTGTTTVWITLTNSLGTTGNFAYFDDFSVGDVGSTTPVPTTAPTSIPTVFPTPTRIPTPTSISSDTTPPSVSITSPLNGATVARGKTTIINASASDNVGVTRVDFYVNGAFLCSDTAFSYTCSWSVPGKPKAVYSLTAKAYDAAGNSRTSTTVSVTAR